MSDEKNAVAGAAGTPPETTAPAALGVRTQYRCVECSAHFIDADSANAHHDATGHYQTSRCRQCDRHLWCHSDDEYRRCFPAQFAAASKAKESASSTPAPAGLPTPLDDTADEVEQLAQETRIALSLHGNDAFQPLLRRYERTLNRAAAALRDRARLAVEAQQDRAELERLRSVARVAHDSDPDKKESLVWDIYESLRDGGGAVRAERPTGDAND